jgi:propanol-preferring alcohol dehydrogenase
MEARVVIPFWRTRAELAEVLALAQAGRIEAHIERFQLTNASAAYEKLHAGKLSGRGVVMPTAA